MMKLLYPLLLLLIPLDAFLNIFRKKEVKWSDFEFDEPLINVEDYRNNFLHLEK